MGKIIASTGTFAWADDVGGVNSDTATALAVDAAGNAYMSGKLNDVEINGVLPTEFVDSFDTNGKLLWNYSIGIGSEAFDSLALYMDSSGTDFLYQTGPYNGGVLKLYGNGAHAGTVNWFKQFSGDPLFGGFGDDLYKVATDAGGNVYVACTNLNNSPWGFDPASTTAAYSAAPHVVAKLDANGNFLGIRSAGGVAVAVDSSGNIHSLGTPDLEFGAAAVYDTGTQDLLPPSNSDMVVALTTQNEGGVVGRVCRSEQQWHSRRQRERPFPGHSLRRSEQQRHSRPWRTVDHHRHEWGGWRELPGYLRRIRSRAPYAWKLRHPRDFAARLDANFASGCLPSR